MLKKIRALINGTEAYDMNKYVNEGMSLHVPEQGELSELFFSHDDSIVHKWHHYLPIYEKFFNKYRNADFKFLEIGVSKGGSLSLWRKYFGNSATIFGIDIDPACLKFNGVDGEVRIGSQSDPAFLRSVVEEMGGVDIVLDDGSHVQSDIRESFHTLYPLLNEDGLYMVEDLHTAYWNNFGGGYKSKNSFMTDIGQMYDDMHHWYHSRGQRVSSAADNLAAIHLYDSLAIFEKRSISRPVHSKVGQD